MLVFTRFSTWAGTNEKILAHISDEGKKLMATADSVFTKVTDDLLSRTVLVEQLELIKNNKTQFLDIWDLSECGPGHGAGLPGGAPRCPRSRGWWKGGLVRFAVRGSSCR